MLSADLSDFLFRLLSILDNSSRLSKPFNLATQRVKVLGDRKDQAPGFPLCEGRAIVSLDLYRVSRCMLQGT
jgi:hypothetical protein